MLNVGDHTAKEEQTNLLNRVFSQHTFHEILSWLAPHELAQSVLVNSSFKKTAENKIIWQRFISQYFPYLKETKSQDYHNAPQSLFKNAYDAYIQQLKEENADAMIPFLLKSLSGQIAKITESILKDEFKRKLYIISAANGHKQALEKLTAEEKGLALCGAATNGYLVVLRELLTHKNISPLYRGDALNLAAQRGHLPVVLELLKQTEISPYHIGRALQVSAENGHLLIVEELLVRNVFSDYVGYAIVCAAKKGHHFVVQKLLTLNLKQFAYSIRAAFLAAIEIGHLAVVQMIIVQYDDAVYFIGIGLEIAAEKDQLHIVKYLLENENITSCDKTDALHRAARMGHLLIIKEFLNHRDISIDELEQALQLACKNNHCQAQELLKDAIIQFGVKQGDILVKENSQTQLIAPLFQLSINLSTSSVPEDKNDVVCDTESSPQREHPKRG